MDWQKRYSKSSVTVSANMCRIRNDVFAMTRARHLLSHASPGAQVSLMDDEHVLLLLAGLPARSTALEQARLIFNGVQLCWNWLDNSKPSVCWKAVSGRSGYQSKEHQNLRDKGPLPEGQWLVKQSEYQQMPKRSLLDQLVNELGRGGWPGGESSWGRHRIWLSPKAGTETHGRSGFSIHGGSDPGSAGCIDMTSNMESFTRMFREYGQDLELTVKYE
jgi:hypothetical protein